MINHGYYFISSDIIYLVHLHDDKRFLYHITYYKRLIIYIKKCFIPHKL